MNKIKFLSLLLFWGFAISTKALVADVIEANIEYENASDYYRRMVSAMKVEEWREASFYGEELSLRFEESPLVFEAYYTLGVASFKLGELEKADHFFSLYLKSDPNPKYFAQSLEYKFEIAKAFDEGYKKHLFGIQKLPKLMQAYEEALDLYNEVITTLPRDPLAAKALYQKGMLLLRLEEYTKSVETLQTLIRRFPKHALTPEAYVGVCDVYATHYKKEFADPDYLDLAEINLRKFKFSFPGEERIESCEKLIMSMKEDLASDLFEIGDFYRRTKKTKAAIIYFNTILKKYPKTSFAKKATKFLQRKEIQALIKQVNLEKETEEKEGKGSDKPSLLVDSYEEAYPS